MPRFRERIRTQREDSPRDTANIAVVSPTRRLLPIVLALATALPFTPSGAQSAPRCGPRLLVLSAFPGEIDHLLTQTSIAKTVTIDGRTFYVGRLRGNDVVLALTGIGLVNADHTTSLALAHFRCGRRLAIDGIVFSGVSGGKTFIGDVTIPARWTIDDGKTWFPADPAMFATAQRASASVKLADSVPLGDVACIGLDPDLVETIRLPHQPQILPGGDGSSSDPFGGRAFPCVPGGGDVFGCRPCRAPGFAPPDLARFVTGALPFIDPNFFLGYFQNPTPSTGSHAADDMETAAVARLAHANALPFIAFRALSDGLGDPLMLPGFPFQFFIYRQIAADNAATTALAFLKAWAAR
jgi:nucleoside phosphorylase